MEKRCLLLRSCFGFLQKVFLSLTLSVFVRALGDSLAVSAPALRQIARYLPHHSGENGLKTHPKSSHDKFKTASDCLRWLKSRNCMRKFFS